MGRTFISYSREDEEFVLKLAKDLRSAGVAILWINRSDTAFRNISDTAIEKAIKSCVFFLLILSPASVVSKNVRDELAFAVQERKVLLLALYQNCDFPFRTKRNSYSDFTKSYDSGFRQLLRALNATKSEKI